jgi:hypothetical protein
MRYKRTLVIERFPAEGGYNATPDDPDTHMAEQAAAGWLLINGAVTELKNETGTELTTHFFWERDR